MPMDNLHGNKFASLFIFKALIKPPLLVHLYLWQLSTVGKIVPLSLFVSQIGLYELGLCC